MKIVTIIENNPITGVRYGCIEVPAYNNNVQRRINKRYNQHNQLKLTRTARMTNTKHK